MTHFSLFSGIGGIDRAAEWAGFVTTGQCEHAEYPLKILYKHWPHVPKWRDIRDVTAESVYERTGLRTVDLVSGGFPCQPFSVAGKQKGKGDDRYLWPEMLRVIRELRPRWVLGENVPGILRIAADDVCKDLERESYDVGIFDYEAAAVGAAHRRERIFFVANRNGNGGNAWRPESAGQQRKTGLADGGYDVADAKNRRESKFTERDNREEQWRNAQIGPGAGAGGRSGLRDTSKGIEYAGGIAAEVSEDVADTYGQGLQGRFGGIVRECPGEWIAGQGGSYVAHANRFRFSGDNGRGHELQFADIGWWDSEPDVGRVAHGIPHRVDRLKALGNAVVPQQIYPILAAIAEIERTV